MLRRAANAAPARAGDENGLRYIISICSVWYYAKTNNYRLLTGDGKLRRSAIADGVQVSGILYITDMLVECGLVDGKDMAEKLNELISINGRLPLNAIKERIDKYKNK